MTWDNVEDEDHGFCSIARVDHCIKAHMNELFWVGLAMFLLGMSKGGFPAGAVALPILILVWPDQIQAARESVAFMLPMLCVMDIVAMLFYRKQVLWDRILPLFPGMLAGVLLASFLFISKESAMLALSDRALRLCIGALGLLFVAYRAAQTWILRRLSVAARAGRLASGLFGFGAGIVSSLAHAAGPVMQMYLLPQKLPKMNFVAANVAFFWVLNLVKLLPFALLGRIETSNLVLGAKLLPVIPVGVFAGYAVTRAIKEKYYVWLIYAVLLVASATLVVKAIGE